jgi:sterol desaturase/sphingolipid hydroxylase (fatty acid hydroxylase superfamily)
MARRNLRGDPTVWAIPFYFASMAVEQAWYRRRPEMRNESGAYEPRDTKASLSMGTLSLVAPLVLPTLLKPFTPGRGRWGKATLGVAVAATSATVVADRYVARNAANQATPPLGEGARSDVSTDPRADVDRGSAPVGVRRARAVQRIAGPAAVITGGLGVATVLATGTTADAMFARRILPDLGGGLLPFTMAMVGWDFLYYWSHRLQHEHRYLWSIHVVHHSSEHYNLSTALRQPVAESFGTMVPFGVISLFGIRPDLILKARGINLIWQFWIHTEAVRSLGPGESVLSTPSAHRVHHGANRQYLDRNHGGILIIWDRIFGTYEPEEERPVYGLTKNINSFSLWTIASHEYREMFADVAASTSWRERLGHVVGPPGWRPALGPATVAAGGESADWVRNDSTGTPTGNTSAVGDPQLGF